MKLFKNVIAILITVPTILISFLLYELGTGINHLSRWVLRINSKFLNFIERVLLKLGKSAIYK